jgi:arylsulfatase A-like enzyme
VENAHITDIAPTLLYLYGMPVPESMDGKILLDAIDQDFAQDRSVSYAKSDRAGVAKKEPKALSHDEAEIVKKHLRELGYME